MDKLVRQELHNCVPDTQNVGELNFLLDEGLDLLSSYAKIADEETRRALLRLVESMAKANS